jgi:hypothetical protein
MLNERQRHVLQLRRSGSTFVAIAAELGVSKVRVSQIFHRADRIERQSKQTNEWTYGLNKKYANALIAAGYVDKNGVRLGLASGKVGVHPRTGKGITPGISHKGIEVISLWIDVDPMQRVSHE